ncbi:5-oxoprolinase subunit B family protein [Paramicrobacterium agarici]|uniref:KipI family sensor histidine kinase inhibitor n=1 Tax=Paramicrobacterium agarici TaxID=630514 RepID=A0A2A9E1C3_9MICO|nr:allophanate hydrolase subunit 1 [Microbacterium agarici]PFG32175.1 KipI family sensor histidine kinase inhibitor [Microbacterium agarici]
MQAASRSIRRVGDVALLVECASLDDVMALHRGLVDRPGSVVDVVPAARTILVTVERPHDVQAVRRWLDDAQPVDAEVSETALVHIDVRYDGADLAEVARLTGMSEREVIARHTRATWRVAFGGFAPGFAYLVTDDDGLAVPRRETPRTHVPAGSVALAGEFTGVYPRSSPGGWQLIGRTDAELWNVERQHPALLEPGATVSFREAP